MNASGIKKSIVLSYISIIFTIISGFLYTPWLIKELGTSDYAIYTIVISIMTYFTIDFGLGATITRFIAKYRATCEEDKIKGLLGIALKMYLTLDCIVFILLVILYFYINQIYSGLTLVEIEKLKVAYLIMGGMTVFCIPVMPINGVYIAYGRIYNVKILDLLNKVFTIGLVCLSLAAGRGLYAVVLANASVTVAINFVKVFYINKCEGVTIQISYKDRQVLKELISFSIWVAIAMIADKFFFAIEPTLLGHFSNSSQVAVFAIAASIEGYVLIFADALNGIFLPEVTSMVVNNRSREELTDYMIKVGRLQLFIVTAFILGIITQGKEFITVWFGSDYTVSYYSVVIVLLPCFIHMTQGIGTEAIYATNMVKYRTLAYCFGAVTNIIVTIVLAPMYGAIGAAIGIAVGFLVGHELTLNIVYIKVIKLNIIRFFRECHAKMIIPAMISAFLGSLISKWFPSGGRLHILLKCMVWAALYLISCFFLYFRADEKKYLVNWISSVFNRRTRG